MIPSIPVKDLVLLGGGHAHVHTIKMMGMQPIEGVRVTLITRDVETPYSGMLPGYVAGIYAREECHLDLGRLCSFAGVRLLHTSANGIDPIKKLVHCSDGRPPVRYDVLSIDIGISPGALPQNPDFNCVTPVKPIDSFGTRWEIILQRVLAIATVDADHALFGKKFHVAVVGGGAGGVELAFAFHARLTNELVTRKRDPKQIKVSIYNRGATLVNSHNDAVQGLVLHQMQQKGIEVFCNSDIVDIGTGSATGERYLIQKDGQMHIFHEAIWCTSARAQSWLQEVHGLATTAEGFICVGPTLESVSTKDIFACGDVAHLVESPRPKAGVFAVRAGPPLTANLRARLCGQALIPWTPQSDFLGIIGTGSKHAIASKGAFGIEGAYVWDLKDRIDRQWMAGYSTQLPDKEDMMVQMRCAARRKLREQSDDDDEVPALAKSMGQATIDMLSKARMRCGGCGSKVGAQVLGRALAAVKSRLHARPEVLSGIGGKSGDDAAMVQPPVNGEVMVHTIDYFRSFISDPYVFGKVSAMHAISDIHAMNGYPVSALALCVLPYGPEAHTEDALIQMLAGAMDALSAERCALVGGHTSEGSEAALGLAVNGHVHPERALSKGPLPVGQTIILTKAIGTGTIMAADMRAKAAGPWVVEALRSMVQSNGPAASILAAHGATACTDVTGFGLVGHLVEMLQFEDEADPRLDIRRQSAARISLSSIPLLTGAAECIQKGVFSSLSPENMRIARAIDNVEFGKDKPQYPLMFDPQTSGGLLATVPNDRIETVLTALRRAGYLQAAAIGRVVERSAGEFPALVYLDP
jgi:selenide,water dikinase